MSLDLPKRPREHVLEELSRQHVQKILPAEWICQTVTTDYGLDLRVEIVVDERVTGDEFSIQLKATDRLKTAGDDAVHRCAVAAAHYYLRRGEPVMYQLYEESDPARAVELMAVLVAFEREAGHPDAEAHARRVEEVRGRARGRP